VGSEAEPKRVDGGLGKRKQGIAQGPRTAGADNFGSNTAHGTSSAGERSSGIEQRNRGEPAGAAPRHSGL